MFASYLSPHLALSPHRSSRASDNASVATHSTAGSRGSKGSVGSKAKAQDYQVLVKELQKHQADFQQARSKLASSLLRMGEYHIRNGEYDEAMMALRESLNENRSVVCSSLSSMPSLDSTEHGDESLVSGMSASQLSGYPHTPKGCGTSVTSSSSSSPYLSTVMSKDKTFTTSNPEVVAAQQKSLGDMITTLSNLGKVHSLRGEDEAAMKYYDERTKIQAVRMDIEEQLSTGTASCLGPAGVFFGEGHIMAEINEDIKALDDLFRGISFRGFMKTAIEEESMVQEDEARNDKDSTEGTAASTDERSTQSTCVDDMSSSTSHRRRRLRVSIETDTQECECKPELPPLRQTRPHHSTSTSEGLKEDNEFADAVDTYRTVIDSYGGRSHSADRHEKKYDDFLRKYELLQCSSTSCSPNHHDSKHSPTSQKLKIKRKEWQLALDIYESAHTAQKEAATRTPFLPGTPRKRSASHFNQDTHLSVASTLIAMGGLHYKLNNVEKELEKYNEALIVYQETLGRDHPHVAGTMKNIGMVLAEQGLLDEAMDKFQEASRIYKAVNDRKGDGPCCDVASALSCMGNVQNRRGQLEDALLFYGEALSIYKSVSKRAQEMGGRSRLALQEVAATLKIMGMVHTKRGELDMAMSCFQDAIDIMRQNFNEKTSGPLVTSILSRIGAIFSKMGKLEESMSHYQEAYDLATRTFGTTDHPEVAQVLHYIGGIHQRNGDLCEAMRCYKNSAKIYQVTLGRNDPIVATTLVCIGSVHYIEKNLDGAMNYYKEALRLNRSAYGTKHPDVIPTMKSIALIHAKQGNFDNAIEMFTEVLNIKCSEVGPIHPDVASAHKRIGNVYYQRGDLVSAEVVYHRALSIYQECMGDDHPATKSALLIVEKVNKEITDAQEAALSDEHGTNTTCLNADDVPHNHQRQLSSSSSKTFFKRAPKGYESLRK